MPSTASRPALHYRREGQGPPVVLSHALGCNLGMWDDLAPALARHFTVVRYDTRCHGESEVITTAFSLADLVNDVVRLIDDLQYEAISWVGLSMGGMIGQGLAIAHPERVNKLVLANTARDQVLAVDAEGYAACCEALRSLDYYAQLDRIAGATLVIAGGGPAIAFGGD